MKNNRLAFAILLAAVILMAVFTYLRMTDSLPTGFPGIPAKGGEGDNGTVSLLTSFTYQNSDHTSFKIYRNWIIRADREFIRAYDMDGRDVWSIQSAAVGRLFMQSSDQYLLIADIGGKSVKLMEGTSKKLDYESEETIINASISPSGYITLVHKSANARNAVSVYNHNGEILFTRYVIERFVTWASVLNTEDCVAISSIDVSGTSASNDIEFLDMKGEPLGDPIRFNNTAFIYMNQFGRDGIFLSDNKKVLYVSKDKGEVWSDTFENGNTICADVYADKAAVVGNSGQDCILRFYDAKKTAKSEYNIPIQPFDLAYYGKMLVMAEGRTVSIFDLKGVLLEEYVTKTDIKELLSLDSNRIVIITGNSVEVVAI